VQLAEFLGTTHCTQLKKHWRRRTYRYKTEMNVDLNTLQMMR